jgi:hypothetical protein
MTGEGFLKFSTVKGSCRSLPHVVSIQGRRSRVAVKEAGEPGSLDVARVWLSFAMALHHRPIAAACHSVKALDRDSKSASRNEVRKTA